MRRRFYGVALLFVLSAALFAQPQAKKPACEYVIAPQSARQAVSRQCATVSTRSQS